jgi:heat shock protein HslJ
MIYRKSYLILAICFCFTLPSFQASAQQPQQSWLDRPLKSWNRVDSNFPKLPRPTPDSAQTDKRCLEQVRPPTSPAENALVRQGWKLYGAVQSYGFTQVITATSSFDGMCRPIQYHAFVYWEGRYAGTLSPVAMDSRTDGALSDIRLTSPTSLSTEFYRYRDSDPLCCPSGVSTVLFDLKRDDTPDLSPISITENSPICPNNQQQAEMNSSSTTLFGKKWKLVEMNGGTNPAGNRPVKSTAYIEFDGKEQRFSGSGSCNRIAGGFKIEGSKLSFSQTISTKMACPNDNVETTFLKLLETTTRFKVEANKLQLYNGDLLILVFSL